MDIDCMRAFIVICDSGRLSKAAEQLFVSKQALSVLVKKMENELGTSLLEREKTGVKLTPAGECFYEYAKRMLALWEQCRQRVENIRNESPRQLRVGLAYMSQNLWTAQCEKAFADSHPEIEIHVESDISKNLLAGLDEENNILLDTPKGRLTFPKKAAATVKPVVDMDGIENVDLSE